MSLFSRTAFLEKSTDHFGSRIALALAFKYGYPDVETMKRDAKQRFSLVHNKIVEMPHTRLLMIGVSEASFTAAFTLLTALIGSSRQHFPHRRQLSDVSVLRSKRGSVRRVCPNFVTLS